MNIYLRYKKLSFWNKLAALGSIASIIAIPFAMILWKFPYGNYITKSNIQIKVRKWLENNNYNLKVYQYDPAFIFRYNLHFSDGNNLDIFQATSKDNYLVISAQIMPTPQERTWLIQFSNSEFDDLVTKIKMEVAKRQTHLLIEPDLSKVGLQTWIPINPTLTEDVLNNDVSYLYNTVRILQEIYHDAFKRKNLIKLNTISPQSTKPSIFLKSVQMSPLQIGQKPVVRIFFQNSWVPVHKAEMETYLVFSKKPLPKNFNPPKQIIKSRADLLPGADQLQIVEGDPIDRRQIDAFKNKKLFIYIWGRSKYLDANSKWYYLDYCAQYRYDDKTFTDCPFHNKSGAIN